MALQKIAVISMKQVLRPRQQILPSIHSPSSSQTHSFNSQKQYFIMVCQHCTQLLGDYAKLVDNLQLILRLFKLTLEQNQSIKTAERLTMLQGHLIKNGKTLDDVIFILAVKCVGCGYV